MPPILRRTARVLPVSPQGEVLLLHEQDPAHPGELSWCSIGGAVDGDESLTEAAVRELGEEAGVVAAPEALRGPVHRDRRPYSWAGIEHQGDHAYFALPVDRDVEIGATRLEPEEVGNILGARWWSPDDLAGAVTRPTDLPDIMRAAIAAVARPDGGDA